MLVRVIKKILNCCWLLPGFLLWASFPPMGEKFDCFFALAPLMWLARNGTTRRSRWLWFVNGFIFWFATLSWMPAIVKNNGPWPLVLLGWFCLAAYCSLFFGAFGWLASIYWQWQKSRESTTSHFSLLTTHFLGLLVVEPVLWCGIELIRSRFLGGFSWNQLGVAPLNAGFGSPASIGGVYLVSAVVILVNGTIASIAERFLTRDRRWWRTMETVVPFLLIFGLYECASKVQEKSVDDGCVKSDECTTSRGENAYYLKVALIQRNFPCCFKPQDAENPVEVYSNLCANVAYLQPDLVILPESAYAEIGRLDGSNAQMFSQWLMKLTGAKAVIAGGGRYTADRKAYNSAALYTAPCEKDGGTGLGGACSWVTSSTGQVQIYDKVHLVPFGEFIPGDKLFPALQKLAPVGSCTPGELKLLRLPTLNSKRSTLKLGIAICYEDTDSAQMRKLAKMGAKVLIFITNDSWFSYSQETVSHAWQATARAIETGRPVLRVGNSGVTGIIYPDGKASWLCNSAGLPLVDAKGTLFDRIPVPPPYPYFLLPNSYPYPMTPTPYVRLGDWPLGIAFALLMLSYILVYLCKIYEQRRIVSLQIR